MLIPLVALATLLAFNSASVARAEPAPLILPDTPRLALDEVGLYAVGYQFRGQPEQRFPDGWGGGFDGRTGVALQPAGEQNGRAALLLHPPWRGGTGTAFQEFRLQLPAAAALHQIKLTGATAMRSDALAAPGQPVKSDGATFRIFANGHALLRVHRADTEWQPFSLDLTEFAGQTLTLRFETDPGPQDNASFDFALWGARELWLDGFAPKAPPPAASGPPLDLRRLYPVENDEVAPQSGFAGRTKMERGPEQTTLTYSGADGTLQYQWRLPSAAVPSPWGQWRLRSTPQGQSQAREIPLAGDASLEWTGPATWRSSRWETAREGLVAVSVYDLAGATATVQTAAKLSGKSLVLELTCDAPVIAALDAGHWGPVLHRQPVAVPYYSGQVYYLPAEQLFVNTFLDWTHSSASSHELARAAYGARTDGTRVPLHERAVYSAAWHAAEVLPNVPNPASPYRKHLGGKLVLDIWGGQFVEIAQKLEVLHGYGLDQCVAIIHDWQRSGYDNALPAHVPANPNLGGEPGMKQLVATAERLGYDIALHENYVDYYPNYEGFDPRDVALDSQGNRVPAWYNPGTKIHSFAVQPHAILPLAREQSAQVHERYRPNADYLDVHSAVPPWFHVDYRAGAAGAGTFQPVWEAHRQLWAFERATEGGPVFGEGANHWFWSGCLDGVEAQFGVGWPSENGRTAPLMVDFDLLKIHPLQFNHGMGYYERWWGTPTWGARPPMEVLDQYRVQEVAYGHAGFLAASTWADVPLAWLEHHLLSPVTARYATARPAQIEYRVEGRWSDGAAAARAGTWKQVRILYENGLTVTANAAAEPLAAGEVTLPPYGWLARGAGVTAWTALCQGVIADYARTADSTFANARSLTPWKESSIHHVQPTLAEFRQTGHRTFSVRYDWQVGERLGRNYHCFVHFVDGQRIVFQQDHALPQPASSWRPGSTVQDGPHEVRLADDLPDGDYSLRVGLYLPEVERLTLQGPNDGEDRIRLGTLQVRQGGAELSFHPEPAAGIPEDPYEHRLNLAGQRLDFGDIRTDGSVLVRREQGDWVLRALPRDGTFSIELRRDRFGHPSVVQSLGGAQATVNPIGQGNWWSIKLNGAREYHWRASSP